MRGLELAVVSRVGLPRGEQARLFYCDNFRHQDSEIIERMCRREGRNILEGREMENAMTADKI